MSEFDVFNSDAIMPYFSKSITVPNDFICNPKLSTNAKLAVIMAHALPSSNLKNLNKAMGIEFDVMDNILTELKEKKYMKHVSVEDPITGKLKYSCVFSFGQDKINTV